MKSRIDINGTTITCQRWFEFCVKYISESMIVVTIMYVACSTGLIEIITGSKDMAKYRQFAKVASQTSSWGTGYVLQISKDANNHAIIWKYVMTLVRQQQFVTTMVAEKTIGLNM